MCARSTQLVACRFACALFERAIDDSAVCVLECQERGVVTSGPALLFGSCDATLRCVQPTEREMVSAPGLQDSDYETLIKNKKIELRFVLENNQIIKRLG